MKRALLLAVGALLFSAALGLSLRAAGAATPGPAGCASKPLIELPVNSWAAARKQLAPPGASSIRLCRYNAFSTSKLRLLAASALVTKAGSVQQIVKDLDALKAFSGTVMCPEDNGAEIDMIVAYPDGHGVFIRADLTGCASVSNGSVTRTAATTSAGHQLLATIERLTGYNGTVF